MWGSFFISFMHSSVLLVPGQWWDPEFLSLWMNSLASPEACCFFSVNTTLDLSCCFFCHECVDCFAKCTALLRFSVARHRSHSALFPLELYLLAGVHTHTHSLQNQITSHTISLTRICGSSLCSSANLRSARSPYSFICSWKWGLWCIALKIYILFFTV